MKNLALAGVCALALAAVGLSPAKAQGTQIAQTTIAGTVCPTTAQVSVGNGRPIVGTQTGGLCVQVSSIAPAGSTSTDASGTVTLGGTYQTVLAASSARKGCLIQNPTTATEVLNIKVGTMASPFTIPAGGSFSCSSPGGLVVTDLITLTAATTSHAFAAVSQ